MAIAYTPSRELLIVQRIRDVLKADGLFEGRVYLARGDALFDGKLPAADVNLVESNPTALASNIARHDLVVRVDLGVREPPDEDESILEAADRCVTQLHALVMADLTLGGLAATVMAGPRRWGSAEADGQILKVEQIFTVVHATSVRDLSRAV